MTRRLLLGTGAAVAGGAAFVGGAQLTGRLDDVADAVGLDPKPLPDPGDTRLVMRAAGGATSLLAALEATAARHPGLALTSVIGVVREQAAAVSGSGAPTAPTVPDDPDDAVRALETALGVAQDDRAADCERAVSPELARVLASMSAGLAQCSRTVRGLR